MLSRREGIAVLWTLFGSGLFMITMIVLGYLADNNWDLTKEATFGFAYVYAMYLGAAAGVALGIKAGHDA